jgi:hypothetical protein
MLYAPVGETPTSRGKIFQIKKASQFKLGCFSFNSDIYCFLASIGLPERYLSKNLSMAL